MEDVRDMEIGKKTLSSPNRRKKTSVLEQLSPSGGNSRLDSPSSPSTPSTPRRDPKFSSMAGLCFRNMANFLTEDNLYGLQSYLENRNVNVDDRDDNGQTILMIASQKGKKSFVGEILNHGADVNAVDYDNWSALLNAAKEGHVDVATELLDHNAVLEHKDMGGWTALMWSCYKGRQNMVKLLLSRGAEANVHGQYHISCLMWASGRGYTQIVRDLLSHGAKVNVGDKYGTTALIWACRKGYLEIVEELLKAGANADTAGMFSWTPLLVATVGNYVDIVHTLLELKPNVNATDKDGCTALTYASKEGFTDIAVGLINAGAYVNLQERSGDTNLIHAAKAGHQEVVEALIKKYADVDVQGFDKKTALYWAVEKGHVDIVRGLLRANPDMELSTKDGDTPLMKATRNRNSEIVQMLVDKKAKVSAVDRKGDTALHIAMRSRSKGIVEILLRNPKNSQILYRPNRAGETPYNIDSSHQKSILGQIFGARRLNTNEDNENMLGYDLYSSALADFLSEPTLSMPICVGLYAKWGSGKSFLLDKLQDEMANFTKQWVEPELEVSWLIFLLILHVSSLLGILLGVAFMDWIVGLCVGLGIFFLHYAFFAAVWLGINRYYFEPARTISTYLARKLTSLKLFLQVLFCYPSSYRRDEVQANPIKFLFTDQAKVSSTGSENSVAFIIASLYDALEREYGVLTTRLYTVFKPKPVTSSSWKWRRMCCLPYFFIFYLTLGCILVGLILFLAHDAALFRGEDKIFSPERAPVHGAIIALVSVVSVVIIANLYTWIRVVSALVYPTKKRLFRAIAQAEANKVDDLQAQHSFVQILAEMVQCIDAFTGNQTRLVIIVDGLDSCEQEKVLHNLDAVHLLFSDPNSPFITILAIDPHIIIKAIETNIHRVFHDFSINGHDYLRNIVHLPFYLQNSGLRRVRVAQNIAAKKMSYWGNDERDSFSMPGASLSASNRRLSSESSMSIPDRFKSATRKSSKKLKTSESVASSMGNLTARVTGAQDLTKVLLTDDYFSDVNPRSMRRLMNVVYITGRLLKAFNIDFNWYHLATWVNITEQWPYRTSWITLFYEKNEDSIEDNTALRSIYEKISDQIPTSKEVEPLLEIDRDERKFEIFLSYHKASLQVTDLKMFLPFTINLDPYIRKVIKDDQQNLEDMTRLEVTPSLTPVMPHNVNPMSGWPGVDGRASMRRQTPVSRSTSANRIPPYNNPSMGFQMLPQMQSIHTVPWSPYTSMMQPQPSIPSTSAATPVLRSVGSVFPGLADVKLSRLSVEAVCDLVCKLEGINKTAATEKYSASITEDNIHGRVLISCDLDELKKVLQMSFGDWELFRVAILTLREQELHQTENNESDLHRNVRFSVKGKIQQELAQTSSTQTDTAIKSPREPLAPLVVQKPPPVPKGAAVDHASEKPPRERSNSIKRVTQQNTLEKQVSLEEQMIMGALQTLSEDAQEDALEEQLAITQQEVVTAPPSVSTLSPILSDPDENGDAMSDTCSLLSASLADVREADMIFLSHTPPMSPRRTRGTSLLTDDRIRSPKRIQVLMVGSHERLAQSPSPTQRPRFSLTSLNSSQASGIEMFGLDDIPPVGMSASPPDAAKHVRAIRPNNLDVTPSPSYERLNKLKNKLMGIISPSHSNSGSPRLPIKKIVAVTPKSDSPDSSDDEQSEETPLVSPFGKMYKPSEKSFSSAPAKIRAATTTVPDMLLKYPHHPSATDLTRDPSISLDSLLQRQTGSGEGGRVVRLNSVGPTAFSELCPSRRQKFTRTTSSLDDTHPQPPTVCGSSDVDLRLGASKPVLSPTSPLSKSVPVTPTTETAPHEIVCGTETVL